MYESRYVMLFITSTRSTKAEVPLVHRGLSLYFQIKKICSKCANLSNPCFGQGQKAKQIPWVTFSFFFHLCLPRFVVILARCGALLVQFIQLLIIQVTFRRYTTMKLYPIHNMLSSEIIHLSNRGLLFLKFELHASFFLRAQI